MRFPPRSLRAAFDLLDHVLDQIGRRVFNDDILQGEAGAAFFQQRPPLQGTHRLQTPRPPLSRPPSTPATEIPRLVAQEHRHPNERLLRETNRPGQPPHRRKIVQKTLRTLRLCVNYMFE